MLAVLAGPAVGFGTRLWHGFAESVLADSAVAECQRLKKSTWWVSTTEIEVMAKIFSYPRLSDDKQHTKQQETVNEKIAECVGKQLLELLKNHAHRGHSHPVPHTAAGWQRWVVW